MTRTCFGPQAEYRSFNATSGFGKLPSAIMSAGRVTDLTQDGRLHMRRSRLFATIPAAFVGTVGLCDAGSVLAQTGDSPLTEDGTGSVELEVRQDGQGNMILVDPRTGEVVGIVQEVYSPTEHDRLSRARLRAAISVKLSVTEVITAAEHQASGSKVLEAHFLPTTSAATYSLKTYHEGAIWERKIDAESGAILNAGRMTSESQLAGEEKAELSGARTASTTIAQAVQIAERRVKGKAISAEIDKAKGGGMAWEVVVVANDRARRVVIDPITGQVKSVRARWR